MGTFSVLLILYSIIFFFKYRKEVRSIGNDILVGRTNRVKKKKVLRKKLIQNIIGYTTGSVCLILTAFFIYSYFYFPIEYKIVSNTSEETDYISPVQYDEDTLFYVAIDKFGSEDKFYYFTIKDNERWMQTVDIDKAKIEIIDIDDIPTVEKKVIKYSSIPQYRNIICKLLINDFGLYHLDYYKLNEDMIEDNVIQTEYVIRIPEQSIPVIDTSTLHFSYKS